jgi:hypothetical protein
MRYLNPQRSKNLQDRKGWIEGWEPRIKADEFIHGLGIGEAYLRHNGRPAKVKLIRADINPPADFDLSADLPRFSQGNEPPLNLTEKVNRVVMDKMRAARNNTGDEPHDTHKSGGPTRKKSKGKPKPSQTSNAQQPPTTPKDADGEKGKRSLEPGYLEHSTSTPSATTSTDASPPNPPRPSTETIDKPAPKLSSPEEREKLEWHGSWDDE